MKIKLTLALAVIGISALGIGCACHRPPPPAEQAGMMDDPGMRGHHRMPPSLLMQALDVNHDGVIDAEEISNAPAELRTLDKNGDGQLTPDELRPPRPPMMMDGPQSGPEKPAALPPG
jgi:hypothetical protein